MPHPLVLPDPGVAVTLANSSAEPFNVLIVGGGVAGPRGGAGVARAGRRAHRDDDDHAPDPEFVYRPMTVREPFGLRRGPQEYPLDGDRAGTSTSSCALTASSGWSG